MRRFLLPVLLALACTPREGEDASAGLRGVAVTPPGPKPEFTLTSTEGETFDFRDRTDGALTLLFFGYTHCPDVCPLHMANIAAVLHDLPIESARRVQVIFVTTDPARDSTARLRTWLDQFDPRFVGLTGTPGEIQAAQAAAGLPPAIVDTAAGHADYSVGHAAQVMAFAADNRKHALYPFGTRQVDWAHDLPKLLEIKAIR
jgi:protein SCO1/2